MGRPSFFASFLGRARNEEEKRFLTSFGNDKKGREVRTLDSASSAE